MRYYRTSDATVVDITVEQFNGLAPVKQAAHRTYVVAPQPTLTATQKTVAGPVVITDAAATKTWTIVEKSQAELDEEAEAIQRAADYTHAKAVYLLLKNGTGTAAERLARIELVLARILRDTLIARGA